jgi:hypothetical protein
MAGDGKLAGRGGWPGGERGRGRKGVGARGELTELFVAVGMDGRRSAASGRTGGRAVVQSAKQSRGGGAPAGSGAGEGKGRRR